MDFKIISYKIKKFLRPFYSKLEIYKLFKKIKEKKEKEKIKKILEKLFFDKKELKILDGPFKGMKYINSSFGSVLLAKIIGTYEQPIQKFCKKIIKEERYKRILNVECAEGYYAVGFAIKSPKVTVIAFDIDPIARQLCKKLMKINKVRNMKILTDFNKFKKITKNDLILCDVDGAEDFLLDPKRNPALLNADLIVETHDMIVPGVTKKIIKRFKDTHYVKIIKDSSFRNTNKKIKRCLSKKEIEFATNERREPNQKWLILIKK